MTRRTYIANVRILDPESGYDATGGLIIEDGVIAGFGPEVDAERVSEDALRIDGGGACIAPGIVDMRVATGEPGIEHKETIRTASHAAAGGGVTTLACLPNTDPVIDDVAAIEFIARRAREEKGVKVFAQAAATRGLGGTDLSEMGLLAEAGAVAFTDGNRAISDSLVMRRALSYASAFGKRIVQHPEDPSLASHGHMNEGEVSTRLGLRGIPAIAEVMMVERDLRLVELTGGHYHVGHVSTAAAVDVIRDAKARGLPVSCDTAPHYFALTEVDVGEYRTFAKVSPPLRTDFDRRAIITGIADGTIDAIASDHTPQDQDSKRQPFAQADPGAAGLETLLPVALELYHKNEIDLLALLHRLTVRPAELLDLPYGRIARGAAADLMLFDPERTWKVDADRLISKSKNSPFDGRPVMGRVLRTFVDGRLLYTLGDSA